MIWAIAIAMWATLFAGVYLLLSRNLVRSLIGLMMLSGAINLVLFASGRVGSILPPVIGAGQTALSAQDANPLPQALVLTAIVIGFALTCFSLILAMALLRSGSGMDINAMRTAEPEPTEPLKPPTASDACTLHASIDPVQGAADTATDSHHSSPAQAAHHKEYA